MRMINLGIYDINYKRRYPDRELSEEELIKLREEDSDAIKVSL